MQSLIRVSRAKNSLRRPQSTVFKFAHRPSSSSSLALPSGQYPFLWLRDSCPSPESIHPSTQQKLHRTSDVSKDASPTSVRVSDDGVHIDWKSGHRSFYPTAYLETYASPSKLTAFHKDDVQIPWDLRTILASPDLFSTTYKSLKEEKGLLKVITQMERYGLVFIKEVPNVVVSDEACEIRALAQMFGEIRKTLYGELWDVRNVLNGHNIAFTDLDLGFHMDLLYA
jgi:gamma-butyrobetaine dioxygenase